MKVLIGKLLEEYEYDKVDVRTTKFATEKVGLAPKLYRVQEQSLAEGCCHVWLENTVKRELCRQYALCV